MKFEVSERKIRDWCEKVFEFDRNFDIYEPRYCSMIRISHIRWGDVVDVAAMTSMIRNRINIHNHTFGDIEYSRIFESGKKDGPIEKDTVGELKFRDNTSHFYAIALYNEVFWVNGVKCLFKPHRFSDDRYDRGTTIISHLRNMYTTITRNIYVNLFAEYGFVWCNLCCWFGLPEDVSEHVEDVHYGQRDLCVFYRDGTINYGRSSRNGVLKFTYINAVDPNPQRLAIQGPEVGDAVGEAAALIAPVAAVNESDTDANKAVDENEIGHEFVLNSEDFMNGSGTTNKEDGYVTPNCSVGSTRSRGGHPALRGKGRGSN